MKFLLIVLITLFSSLSIACTEDGRGGFLPENELFIPAGVKTQNGMTEEQFNNVIDRLKDIYAPIIDGMRANLQIFRRWDDGTVNASAQRFGNTWIVNMYGGLARHPAITPDGFALVVCHEIGHHIGGAPKVGGLFNRWASNEGQSDYFATAKCLRQLFLNDNNAEIISRMEVPATLSTSCAKAHPSKIDREICIRGGMAGKSVAGLFASLRSQAEAQFDTPDQNVVKKTDHSHPAHQCRMDTYFQGALCEKSMNEEVSQKDEVQGTCHTSTGHKTGLRPLCWYKSKK